jgi:dienelactone hydrolase
MQEHHLRVARHARYHTLGGDGVVSSAWIVLHGYGQLAADFLATFEPIAGPERLVVAPEALNRFYLGALENRAHTDSRVGATWMTRADREHEIVDYVAYLDALHAHVVKDGVHVTVLGFSQGVATLTRWLARSTARAHRAVLWAGELPPDVNPAALAERVQEVVVVQGERDRLTHWTKPDELRARMQDSDVGFRSLSFDGGHRIDSGVLRELAV